MYFGATAPNPQGDSPAIVEGLLHEARTALQRLSGGGDETARVLGGGVDNRFNTRHGGGSRGEYHLVRYPKTILFSKESLLC